VKPFQFETYPQLARAQQEARIRTRQVDTLVHCLTRRRPVRKPVAQVREVRNCKVKDVSF